MHLLAFRERMYVMGISQTVQLHQYQLSEAGQQQCTHCTQHSKYWLRVSRGTHLMEYRFFNARALAMEILSSTSIKQMMTA